MRPHTESEKLTLIDAIAGVAAGTPRKTDSGFVRALYRNVPPEDLLPRSQDDLLHAAASLWELLQERRPGRPKLRVLDPQQHGHAWCAGRTVVQIVNDDMPFLVDSVTLALNARNLVVNLVIHPVLTVERAASGKLLRLVPPGGDGARKSVMQVEIAGVVDEATRWAIADDLEAVLADVRATVVDYELMKAKAERIAQDIARSPVGAAQAAEVSAFLSWLADRNFTFLGYREYRIENEVLSIVPGSGLGLLRDEEYLVFDGLRNLAAMSPGLKPFMESQEVLTVSKSTRQSTVHRRAQMDTISIKIFNDAGSVVGQKLFLGLFTSQSYMRPLQSVPILRRKVKHVIDRSGFTPEGHDAKELQHILDSFPRDELFQFDENELLATAVGILNLQERQRIALFLRSDQFGRFVSCLVYVPRDRYSTAVRRRMGAILTEAFAGTLVSEATHLDKSALARIHFIIGTTPGSVPEVDHAALEQRLVEAGRSWADRLGEALSHAHDPQIADRLLRRYGEAFPSNYAERTGAAAAVRDIAPDGGGARRSTSRPFDGSRHGRRAPPSHVSQRRTSDPERRPADAREFRVPCHHGNPVRDSSARRAAPALGTGFRAAGDWRDCGRSPLRSRISRKIRPHLVGRDRE